MGLYSRVIFPCLCDLVLGQASVARHRRELLAAATGDMLEIGFGTGLNLPHYPDAVRRVTALDPNPGMHRRARRRMADVPFEVASVAGRAEELPFDAGRFDGVVSTFTLCSVADAPRVLREAHRVLRPGGRLLFLEHGLSPDAGVRAWQRRLNRLEQWLADGCRLDRDMAGLVRAAPLASTELKQFYLKWVPRTHGFVTRGVATRSG